MKGLISAEKEEFQLIFSDLQKNNIFLKDVPHFIIDGLVEQIFIIADNWLTHNRLILKLNPNEAIQHYTLLQMNLFYPLLNKEQQNFMNSNTSDNHIILRKGVYDDLPAMLQLFTATIDEVCKKTMIYNSSKPGNPVPRMKKDG